MIRVCYFARVREAVGQDSEQLAFAPGLTVAALRAQLAARGSPWDAALSDAQRLLAAVNQTMATPDTALSDGDEVAFFPMVTGG